MLFAVWTGLEPATPCVTGRYSNQLNYQTVAFSECKCKFCFPIPQAFFNKKKEFTSTLKPTKDTKFIYKVLAQNKNNAGRTNTDF